jgi:hypothetical protein
MLGTCESIDPMIRRIRDHQPLKVGKPEPIDGQMRFAYAAHLAKWLISLLTNVR